MGKNQDSLQMHLTPLLNQPLSCNLVLGLLNGRGSSVDYLTPMPSVFTRDLITDKRIPT